MTDGFPLCREASLRAARDLVADRFPEAEAAWLAGSVAEGRATETSDLDVVVLLGGAPALFRESLLLSCEGHLIPVELFVHTVESVRHYVRADRARARPTLARMISEGVPLRSESATATALVDECRDEVKRGPDPLSAAEIDVARYHVTDLLEDLRAASAPDERAVLAASVWEAAARLLLAADRTWQGAGKGLLRALRDRDATAGDRLGEGLTSALLRGVEEPQLMVDAVRAVLDRVGGALFAGYRLGG